MSTFIHQAALALQEETEKPKPKEAPRAFRQVERNIELLSSDDSPEMIRILEAAQRLKKLMAKKKGAASRAH